MSLLVLAACVLLGSFGVVNLLLSLGLGAWSLRRRRFTHNSDALLALRYLPSIGAATFALGVALPAFVMAEPSDTAERAGGLLVVVAALGAVPLAVAAARAWRAYRASRRLLADLTRQASRLTNIDAPLPAYAVDGVSGVVAVLGLRRPRLFIGRDVLAALAPEELRAAIAHETAHARRSDNLRRLLLRACPDWLSFHAVHDRIFAAWCEATEALADDHAARLGREPALALASALVAVARLGPREWPALPLSALGSTSQVARRIRRLVEPAGVRPGTAAAAVVIRAGGFGAVIAWPALAACVATSPALALRLHALAEAVVQAVL